MDLRHPVEHQALFIEPWALLVEYRAPLTGLRHFRAYDSMPLITYKTVGLFL